MSTHSSCLHLAEKEEKPSDFCTGWFYANMTQTRVILEGRTLIKKMPLLDWPMGKPVGHLRDW